MNPDVLEIIKESLIKKGFDGLQFDGECACSVDDFAPCGEINHACTAGYKRIPPESVNSEYDFYIVESKNDVPWEE